jgi:hypothetical protein
MIKNSTKPKDDSELHSGSPTIDEKIQAFVNAGEAEWNGKKFRPGKPAVINRSEKQISDLVVENRDVDYLS